jgi:hypothetical protein
MDKLKEIYLQQLAEAALEHCIAVDYDFIVSNYDDWDDYLMETLGTTQKEVKELGGTTLNDLWSKEI